MKVRTKSDGETKQLGATLGKKLKDTHCVIALFGELGAGKTTFAQGFAQGLGIQDKVLSPTFVIMRQYQIPGTQRGFYHIDLYRLDDVDPKAAGFSELFEGEGIVLVEWPEKLKKLPDDMIKVSITKSSETQREILIDDTI